MPPVIPTHLGKRCLCVCVCVCVAELDSDAGGPVGAEIQPGQPSVPDWLRAPLRKTAVISRSLSAAVV